MTLDQLLLIPGAAPTTAPTTDPATAPTAGTPTIDPTTAPTADTPTIDPTTAPTALLHRVKQVENAQKQERQKAKYLSKRLQNVNKVQKHIRREGRRVQAEAKRNVEKAQRDTSDKLNAFQSFLKGEGTWDGDAGKNSGPSTSTNPPKAKKAVRFHDLVAKAQEKHKEEEEKNKKQIAAAAAAAAAKAALVAATHADRKAAEANAGAVGAAQKAVEKKRRADTVRAAVTTPLLAVLVAAQLSLQKVHDLVPYYLVAAGMLHVGLQLFEQDYTWVNKGVLGYITGAFRWVWGALSNNPKKKQSR